MDIARLAKLIVFEEDYFEMNETQDQLGNAPDKATLPSVVAKGNFKPEEIRCSDSDQDSRFINS